MYVYIHKMTKETNEWKKKNLLKSDAITTSFYLIIYENIIKKKYNKLCLIYWVYNIHNNRYNIYIISYPLAIFN